MFADGGPASPRLDPLGKGMAQLLLEMPVEVARPLAAALAPPSQARPPSASD